MSSLAVIDLISPASSYLLVFVAVAVMVGFMAFFARKITRTVAAVGEGYTELYKQQHREVMEALQGETRKALEDTKALVMEHTELERILRVLADRADDNADDKESLDADDRSAALRGTQG